MFVLDAFKGHLTLDVISVIHATNTDLVFITGGMTSQLHIPANMHFDYHLKQMHSE
jgi:hypothetical protein